MRTAVQARVSGERRVIALESLADSNAGSRKGRRCNVLLLGDDRHVAGAVQDYLRAIREHSRHRVHLVNPIAVRAPGTIRAAGFDAVIIHYSILVLRDYFLPQPWREWLGRYRGAKIQIIQDEYRWVDEMAERMAELGVQAVVSSLDLENIARVYHHRSLRDVLFVSALPGYVTGELESVQPRPLANRELDVVYRGREVPFWLGRMSREKIEIARQARAMAARHGLRCDIETAEDRRIYGADWQRFLSSGRCVLATEGGASIFDFDGGAEAEVARFLERHPGAGFNTVWEAVLAQREGNVVHRTLTPRVFEAAASRTALIMYPGHYRGVLDPWEHYIPLAPDGSNEEEVVRHIRDIGFLEALTARVWTEIIGSGRYAGSRLARAIDTLVDTMRGDRTERRRPDWVAHAGVGGARAQQWLRNRRAALVAEKNRGVEYATELTRTARSALRARFQRSNGRQG